MSSYKLGLLWLAPVLAFANGSKGPDALSLYSQSLRKPFTLQTQKDKTVSISRAEDLDEIRFNDSILELIGRDGKALPFALSTPIKADREGNPTKFDSLEISAAQSGQNVALRIVQTDSHHVSNDTHAKEACSGTRTRRVCRGTGADQVCQDESVTWYGERDVVRHEWGEITHYDLSLSDASGGRLFTANFTADDVDSYSSNEGPCVEKSVDRPTDPWRP